MSNIYFYTTSPLKSDIPFHPSWTKTGEADRKLATIEGSMIATDDAKVIHTSGGATGFALARQYVISNIASGTTLGSGDFVSGVMRGLSYSGYINSGYLSGYITGYSSSGTVTGVIAVSGIAKIPYDPDIRVRTIIRFCDNYGYTLSDVFVHTGVIWNVVGLFEQVSQAKLSTTGPLSFIAPEKSGFHHTYLTSGTNSHLVIEFGITAKNNPAKNVGGQSGLLEFGLINVAPHAYDLPFSNGNSTPASQWLGFNQTLSYAP